MNDPYSVLMSVYARDNPLYLAAAIDSILGQTLKTREIVLVCDGPLTRELDQVLDRYGEHLKVVRLGENQGLGAALSEGLNHCSCEWVARMDSDDISAHDRCARQMEYLQAHPEVDVLSGTLAEFEGGALTEEEARQQVLSYKCVPGDQQAVGSYIRRRNPVNHPCVMFRKSRVQQAGGYQPCPLFEDYDLWVRMYLDRCHFANLEETLLYMRVDGMHQRRGGIRYVKANLHFWTQMYRRHVISLGEYVGMVAARSAVSLLPNRLRRRIYDKKLRKA